MSQLLYVLALLACPVAMGVMMWMMSRGKPTAAVGAADKQVELARLRAQIDQLHAERTGAGGDSGPVNAAR